MRMLRVSLLALTLALPLAGCGGGSGSPTAPDPGGAQQQVDAGNAALAAGNYEEANARFRQAIALDPSNGSAQIGAAVTEIYILQNDGEVAGILDLGGGLVPLASRRTPSSALRQGRMGGIEALSRAASPLAAGQATFRMLGRAVEDPPALSQIQHVVKTKILPKLQYAEERLMVVEQHPDFVWRIPPAVTEAPDTIEIDLGEVLVLDAVVNSVQGWLGLLVAYDFDVPGYEHVNAESLLAEGTDFATLHGDGALMLGSSRLNFLRAKNRVDAAAAFIGAETDDQSDDLIPAQVLDEPGFAELMDGLEKIETTLTGPLTFTIQDGAGQPFEMVLYLGRFFTDPIADLKTMLPAHAFDELGDPYPLEPLDFPDPTFNGIFPQMTDELWRQLAGSPPPPVAARRP